MLAPPPLSWNGASLCVAAWPQIGRCSVYFDNGNLLDQLLAPGLAPLQQMADQLDTLIQLHQQAFNHFTSETQQFADGNSPTFHGAPAQKIALQVQSQTLGASDRIRNMTDVYNATTTCLTTISASDAHYYGTVVAPDIYDFTSYVLTGQGDFSTWNVVLTAGDVFGGGGVVASVLSDVRRHYKSDRYYYYTTVSPVPNPENQAEQDAQTIVDPWLQGLPAWADEVKSALDTWHGVVQTNVNAVLRWQGEILENETALAQQIFSQYGTGQPIGITTVGNNTLLVTVAGTEFNWGQGNNPGTAIDSGLGDTTNIYEQEVNAAIRQYIKDHHLPPGTNVIIAGHSLGGMVAEQDASNNSQNMLGAYSYDVTNVITFGSPNLTTHQSGVAYQQYFDQYDDVPFLNGAQILPALGFLGLGGTIIAGLIMNANPNLKAQYLGETYIPDLSHYSNPGDAHGAYIYSSWLGDQTPTYSIDQTGTTTYYAAPNV